MEITVKKNKGITLIALVITIIVLLILAGVSIAMLTGPNGLLTQAENAKTKTEESGAREKVEIAVVSSYGENGIDIDKFEAEIKGFGGEVTSKNPLVVEIGDYEAILDETTGEVETFQNVKNILKLEAPEEWETTKVTDTSWYSYGGAKVNAPKLKGNMMPIKYTGTIEASEATAENKWANAITTDGSMWVWIPRYAYKITEGYHKTITETTEGEIEVAFVDTKNNFLNGENGAITDDPSEVTYTDDGVQEQWLVHPAFTSNAENGGGFGELKGLWVGKFEATGTYDKSSSTGTLSVKPGETSLGDMAINEQYKLAKSSTFGESVKAEELGSHMAKNSEWGAVVYLGHSQYGTKGEKVEQNTNENYYTGGNCTPKEIYTTNKTQSTTHNATGVYDMNGGAVESVASYVNNNNGNLTEYGGDQSGDLCDNTGTKREESTAYKTVYAQGASDDSQTNYEANAGKKGDAIYETSGSGGINSASWFSASALCPNASAPFFLRGGNYNGSNAGSFYFSNVSGASGSTYSFRPMLVF